MSRKGKALKRRGSSKAGRPKKAGERYANGRLKPSGPNQLIVDRRKELAADITMATNPLDCAYANGWLTMREYRDGVTYASLQRQAGLGSPGLGAAVDLSASGGVEVEVQKRTWGTMGDAEIAEIWDSAFSDGMTLEQHLKAQAAAMTQWKAVAAVMRPPERNEVDLVCVQQSWPQWLIQRSAGQKVKDRAASQKRDLTESEQAYVDAKFNTSFEAKRKLLVEGLRAVHNGLAKQRPAGEPMAPRAAPKAPLPRWMKRSEKTTYIDSDGNVLREATRLIVVDE